MYIVIRLLTFYLYFFFFFFFSSRRRHTRYWRDWSSDVCSSDLGEFWRRDPEYPRAQWTELLPLLRDGRIAPQIGSVYPLSGAAAALAEIDERRATGKVVLAVR